MRRIRQAKVRPGSWRVLVAAAFVTTLGVFLWVQPAASQPNLSERAERMLEKRLSVRLPVDVGVSCKRVRRARGQRARWSCVWQGGRDLDAGRRKACKGRTSVVLSTKRRWRKKRLRQRCVVQDAPSKPTRYFGFSDNSWLDPTTGVTAEDEAMHAEQVGANAHRIFLDWRHAEPARDRYDETNFARYTRLYRALEARGIRPLITIGLAPSWAWEPGTICTGDCRYPPARRYDGEWAEITREIVRRYPKAAGIEIWNEPNIDLFWKHPDPKRYVELLRIGHDAIKGTDPTMPVIGGALGNIRTRESGHVPTGDFLRAAYRYGMASAMDALSLHSYPFGFDLGPSSLFGAPFEEVAAVLRKYGDEDRRLWVTEVGVSTSDPRPQYRFDEEQQAAILLRVQRHLMAKPNVDAVFFHSLFDRPRYPAWSQEHGYGIVRAGEARKPKRLYCTLVRAAESSHSSC